MSRIEQIIERHGHAQAPYYEALAELFAQDPAQPFRRGERVCGNPALCAWLLKQTSIGRPPLSFRAALDDLAPPGEERARLNELIETADTILSRSIMNGHAHERGWIAWLSALSRSDLLHRVARRHAERIPLNEVYDFAQIARSYIAEIAGLIAGVNRALVDRNAAPIAAVVDYLDGHADSVGDALRAAAGLEHLSIQLATAPPQTGFPAHLRPDIANRTVLLITGHESTAHLLVTACRLLKREPGLAIREAIHAAADMDFPIQSVLRVARRDLEWNGLEIARGTRLRIHIAAAFAGSGQANRSFGFGRNTCPGSRIALAAAAAFLEEARGTLARTEFLAPARRKTSIGARRYLPLEAMTAPP